MSAIIRVSVLFSVVVLSMLSGHLLAAEIRVAVASNFLIPIKSIANAYEQQSGDRLIISAGSTGKLYAQIINGAPFDLFLAANSREPLRLEKEGYALDGSRFTYARGKLVLWNPKGIYKQSSFHDVLITADYKRLSLANPQQRLMVPQRCLCYRNSSSTSLIEPNCCVVRMSRRLTSLLPPARRIWALLHCHS